MTPTGIRRLRLRLERRHDGRSSKSGRSKNYRKVRTVAASNFARYIGNFISLRLLALLKHAILCVHNHNGVLCLPIGKMTVYLGQPRSWATQVIGITFTRLIQ